MKRRLSFGQSSGRTSGKGKVILLVLFCFVAVILGFFAAHPILQLFA